MRLELWRVNGGETREMSQPQCLDASSQRHRVFRRGILKLLPNCRFDDT